MSFWCNVILVIVANTVQPGSSAFQVKAELKDLSTSSDGSRQPPAGRARQAAQPAEPAELTQSQLGKTPTTFSADDAMLVLACVMHTYL